MIGGARGRFFRLRNTFRYLAKALLTANTQHKPQFSKDMEAVDLYKLRPYRQSDINFIQNSWGSSYYKGAEYSLYLSPREFNEKHRPIREDLLSSPSTALIIACGIEDEDLILGWILIEKPTKDGLILHYLYVKEAFKGEGISDHLLKNALPIKPILVTHMTDRARKIIRKKKDYFKDYYYAKETIMVRDNYLSALPRSKDAQ